MTPAVWAAIIAAAVSLIGALIGAVSMFSVHRATATKTVTEAEGVEANTAEVFSRLAAEWTQRADARVEKLEQRIGHLVTSIEELTEAVDGVLPLLESSVSESTPEAAENVVALRMANRAARRLAG